MVRLPVEPVSPAGTVEVATEDRPAAVQTSAQRGELSNTWQDVGTYRSSSGWNFWKGDMGTSLVSQPITLTAGLNQKTPIYLNLTYAVPGYECWLWVCDGKTLRGKNSTNLGDNFVYDIFPATSSFCMMFILTSSYYKPHHRYGRCAGGVPGQPARARLRGIVLTQRVGPCPAR